MLSDTPQNNQYFNYLNNQYFNTFLRYILVIGATMAGGLLGYAGAIAIGFSIPVAIAVFALNCVVSVQINNKMITNGINKRLIPFIDKLLFNKQNDINIKTNIFYLLISFLATISFSATTYFAAIGLFNPLIAFAICAVTSVSYFLIGLESLNKFLPFYSIDNITKKSNKFLQELGDKPNYQKKSILYSLLAVVTPICIAAIILTTPSWLIETQLGLAILMPALIPAKLTVALGLITASCQIFINGSFMTTSPLKAVFKLTSFEPKNALGHIRSSSAGVKYNPFNWLSIMLAETTAITLFLSHCIAHAFMSGSRDLFGTFTTTTADAYTDGSIIFVPTKKHSHNHEPFDGIIMVAKTIITTPAQLFAMPLHMAITHYIDNNNITNSHRTLLDYFKLAACDGYYFVEDYLAKRNESHDHNCCPKDHTKKPLSSPTVNPLAGAESKFTASPRSVDLARATKKPIGFHPGRLDSVGNRAHERSNSAPAKLSR